jgi:hypothetical protein
MSWDSSEDRALMLGELRGFDDDVGFESSTSRSIMLGGFAGDGPEEAPGIDTSYLYNLYGEENVRKWADLDNEGNDDDIDARIAWAVEVVRDEIRSMLLYSASAYPTTEGVSFRMNVMRKVGVMLYEARGVTNSPDDQGTHRLTYNKKQAEKYFKMVLAGQISTGGVASAAVPFTVGADDLISSPSGLES